MTLSITIISRRVGKRKSFFLGESEVRQQFPLETGIIASLPFTLSVKCISDLGCPKRSRQ